VAKKHWSRRQILQAAGAAGAGAVLGASPATTAGRAADAASIEEPPRRTPVVEECDLCVVGGSCTGVFAAVAAARLGAKVALVENLAYFGGVATASLVNIWHSTLDANFDKPTIAGLTTEITDRLRKRDGVITVERSLARHYVLNSAELAMELDALVLEAGVRPFLHTRFVAPVVAPDGRVTAAIVEDKTGRRAIRARFFVDATGDGDLVARIPLPTRTAESLQPPTTCFIVHGLDEVARHNQGFHLSRAVHDPRYPQALKDGFLWSAEVPGVPGARMIAGTRVHGVDCSDADQLTRAEMEGRRQVRAMCDIVRENFEKGRALGITALPARIGIRQTRQAECLHTITESELLGGTRFPDAIANGTYPVDIHHNDKPGVTFRYLDGTERYSVPGQASKTGRWRPETDDDPPFYQIPYRSMVPRGSQNVLVAGRLIDTDHGAYGAVRVMVNCNQTGQAAGVAAHLALRAGATPAEVDPQALRQRLKDQGALIL